VAPRKRERISIRPWRYIACQILIVGKNGSYNSARLSHAAGVDPCPTDKCTSMRHKSVHASTYDARCIDAQMEARGTINRSERAAVGANTCRPRCQCNSARAQLVHSSQWASPQAAVALTCRNQ
jgi:hypothetical protein